MCNSGIMASDERVGNTDKQTGCAIGSSKELWLSEQGRKMRVCMAPRETSRVRAGRETEDGGEHSPRFPPSEAAGCFFAFISRCTVLSF
ncbi:hypothetical protein MCOR22_005082 [Pyricularia oryzae]|uniref:Uncharacterized protein n=1 Tax=Pyricularia oryzae TaxID=318829 RepID=A0A4P7MX80_PYROR|nr:hypothetical protein MCOR22_005082 [Pyricularia oryzae]QBZ54553.1 hypothetical protein PoMZ_10253 [Pyricularia oryzae]